jgi:arylsulfatase A-like enzyme
MAKAVGYRRGGPAWWRILRAVGLAVGVPLVVVALSALLLLLGRCTQVRLFPEPPDAPHLAQKQAYLDSIAVDAAEAPPNFVIILFDDLGHGDLSSYGNRLIDTPSIDGAAEAGLNMTHFYSASPVCTASRAALLTGRYPTRTRTDRHVFFPEGSGFATGRRMLGWANELPSDEITLAEALGRAGYATGMVGKWHLGSRAGFMPNDFGFDQWMGVLYSNDMWPLDLYRDGEVIQEDHRPGGVFAHERDETQPLGEGGIDQSQLTGLYTAEAIDFIEDHADRPFLLYVAHTFPHVPHYPSREHAGESQGGRYGDVVEDLDRSTGAILDAIDRLGIAERTLVLITSDNGADYNGSPGGLRGRKGSTYEGGQRVPMIVVWPGHVEAGRVDETPAMNIDLFPTLLSLAGLPLPEDRIIDGIDLSPLLVSESGASEETASADAEPPPVGHAPDARPLYFFPVTSSVPDAVRLGVFKWKQATGDMGRDRGHLSRVDLDAEAHELSDLAPWAAEDLARRLDAMREEVSANPRGWVD